MVLHNNKWDRRAKYKYLKKHGLSSSDVDHVADPEDPESEHEEEKIGTSEPKATDDGSEIIGAPDLPDQDELDPEVERMFRLRTAAARKPLEKIHPIEAADPAEIERATAGVERSKMNRAVRERFGSTVAAKLRKNPLDLDSDSDFDDFMDELDESDPAASSVAYSAPQLSKATVEINKDKQEFLDRLF